MSKDIKEKNKKSIAGKLLSKFVREISEETTEVIIDPESGLDRMATKAEALARLMWKNALGYKEIDVKTNREVIHIPDKTFIGMLWDRIEGRAALIDVKTSGDRTSLADRVSEQGKKRINQIAKSSCSLKSKDE